MKKLLNWSACAVSVAAGITCLIVEDWWFGIMFALMAIGHASAAIEK